MTRRKYQKPPIKEALCEVKFHDSRWGFASVAGVYELLKDSYPQEPELVAVADAPSAPDDEKGRRLFQRYRFTAPNEKESVLVSPSGLSVHTVDSYPGWERFKESLLSGLSAYLSVANPSSVSRIGIRYINLIEFDSQSVDLKTFFTSPPSVPSELSLGLSAFLTRLELTEPGSRRKLISTFASAVPEKSGATVVLDLDAIEEWQEGEMPAGDNLGEVIESLRAFERDAFEAMITEQLRETFDG